MTGELTITASAPDEIDMQSKTQAIACFTLDVDLTARATGKYDNWLPG